MMCSCDNTGEASRVRCSAMDQDQSAVGADSQRRVRRHGDRLRSSTSQSQRRDDPTHLVPRRRADEDAQDDHFAAHHIQPHLRYSG